MDTRSFFLLHHARVHAQVEKEFLQGLSEEQMRCRPGGLNSIAWIVWHMARCEDVLNVLIADHPQVLDHEHWFDQLQVANRDVGTGMADADVSALSASVDLTALHGYYNAVGQSTVAVVTSLQPQELDAIPDLHRLHPDVEGVFQENAMWAISERAGLSKGWWLGHLGIAHNQMHRGEALTIRGLQGIRNR
ncbi:MAG TPA: DinB family protein [Candidatus Binatia bacterium]|jgi:hypothetical protein|nr:DinB family protein [Candidatus Binatia bacterium]